MVKELTAEQARLTYQPAAFECNSTADLQPYDGIIGQDRALSALKFGLNIRKPGFNIFVSGFAGTGKTTVIKAFLDAVALQKATPDDWCYVYNFKDPYCPRALRLPLGTGQTFQKDIRQLIDNTRRTLMQTFTSKEYSTRRSEAAEAFTRKREAAFQALSERSRAQGLLLKASQIGLVLLPAKGDQPMTDEDYGKLSQVKKDELMQNREQLSKELKEKVLELRLEESNLEKQLAENDHQIAGNAIEFQFQETKTKYKNLPQVIAYLNEVEEDVIENFKQFFVDTKTGEADPMAQLQEMSRKQTFSRYEVNIFIDRSEAKGAPVVLELNPTFNNLFGRIEREAQFGALYTDFTMIKNGSMHVANGGFLVMRIEDVLTNFQSWEGLKRTLRDGKLAIEDIGERLGFMATKSLKPEPIPLEIKVVLIGEPQYYYALMQYDLEFRELFKVKADFDYVMERNEKNLKDYASVICRICNTEKMKHLSSDALAKILEHSSRLADDQSKLSTLFADITDIIREANFWADEDKTKLIEGKHILKAIEQKVYRSNLVQQHVTEAINKGIYKIDTDGQVVGQVNGLAVMGFGDMVFGRPTRITASLGMGREGVVNIEREANLSGNIHTKGVLILNGYMIEKYATGVPLSLSARLVFEQSYDEIDGDSASSTELYVLLSRLAEAPIRQEIAVTGSVNQKGEVQAIGGVNEKIEGFFEICRYKGLTGQQGVMIPQANVVHLMLKEEVVDAVKIGVFHIYPVINIDEGIEILTGIPAGKNLKPGKFEANTINDRVQKRLLTMAYAMRDFGRTDNETKKDKHKTKTKKPQSPVPKKIVKPRNV